ncbi:MAG: alpha/beta fold hydrolase [Nitriliruptorales bacterium]|nr:alpha/beta fold hydrolase [Nitriliruptorales bacterium]
MATRPDWVDGTLYPFADHWRDIDGHEVHYLDVGDGPTLLLLHGNPTWSFLYRDVIARLAPGYRCVAPDYPGFGLSTPAWNYDGAPSSHADVLEQLVVELDLRDVVLVVHDWGGPIGFAMAGRHPERFRGVVITNTWAWPLDGDPWVGLFSRLAGNPLSRELTRRANLFVNGALPTATTTKLSSEVMQHYRMPFPTPESRRFTARLPRDLVREKDLELEAAQAVVTLSGRPALIVWGGRDPLFPPRVRKRFENAFPDHRSWVLEDASHFLQEDAPHELAAAIDEWHGNTFPS